MWIVKGGKFLDKNRQAWRLESSSNRFYFFARSPTSPLYIHDKNDKARTLLTSLVDLVGLFPRISHKSHESTCAQLPSFVSLTDPRVSIGSSL
jgi:hypothetical protein